MFINKKFKIELVMRNIELAKKILQITRHGYYEDQVAKISALLDDVCYSAAKPNVSGELPPDEECKCIRYTGGDKWYSNGCKIHPDK